MKRSILIFLLTTTICFGQDREKYLELIKDAHILYENREFEKSGKKYTAAFRAFGNQGEKRHRYKAACAWALSRKVDSAYTQLYKITKHGSYADYKYITTDSNLHFLHQDKRWKEVIAFVIRNQKRKIEADAKLDKPLVALLDTIYKEDQNYRRQLRKISKKYGRKSDELKAHWKIIAKKDSLNVIEVSKILNERGWLGADIIGYKGNKAIFLVIQHSELETQVKYLPMMREAVKKGNAKASSLALLEDRVALRQGKRQIYGTQIHSDPKTREMFVAPLIDPENVDRRRAEVGLGKLAEYIHHWKLTWDVEKHKARTAKIEAARKL